MKFALVGLVLVACSGSAGGFRRTEAKKGQGYPFQLRVAAEQSAAGVKLVNESFVNEFLNQVDDPQSLLADGLGAIGDLVHKARGGEQITGKDVADIAVGIGITVLGMVNPLLGVFATFLWGFVGGDQGGGDPLQDMKEEIMGEVKVLIRASKNAAIVSDLKMAIKSTLNEMHSCCHPQSDVSMLDNIIEWSEQMNASRGKALGECWDGGDGCREWQQASESLEYAIMYAQVHLQLDTMMMQFSEKADGHAWALGSLETNGRLYAKHLSAHFNEALRYRTSPDTFDKQTYSKNWRSYVPWYGKSRCDMLVQTNAWDKYSATAYAEGRGDCFQKGHARTCKKDGMKGNREECGSLFPKWEWKVNSCQSNYINEIKAVFKNKLRPALDRLTYAFPQENGQPSPLSWV